MDAAAFAYQLAGGGGGDRGRIKHLAAIAVGCAIGIRRLIGGGGGSGYPCQ